LATALGLAVGWAGLIAYPETVRAQSPDSAARPLGEPVWNQDPPVAPQVPIPNDVGLPSPLEVPSPEVPAAPGLIQALPDARDRNDAVPRNDNRVTLRVEDEDVRRILGLMGRQASANILISPAVQGQIRVELNNVRFDDALAIVAKLANLGVRREGELVYVYTARELDDIKANERQTAVRIYHLNYIRAVDLILVLRPFLSRSGMMSMTPPAQQGLGGGGAGGGSAAGGAGGGGMAGAGGGLGMGMGGGMSALGGGAAAGGGGAPGAGGAQGSMPPVTASAGGAVAGAAATGGNSLAYHDVVVIRDYPDNLKVIDEIVARLDVQPPQVLVEAIILSVTLDDSQQLGVNFSVIDRLQNVAFVNGSANAINNIGGFRPAKVLTAPSSSAAGLPAGTLTNLQPGFASPIDQGLRFGFVTHNISGFITALETMSKVNILASPRVLVLNKQRAEIQLGQRLGYKNTVTNLVSSLQTVDFLSVGTLLTLRPYVATDGMIRMEIHPEKSTGALDANGIPQTNTQELTTNILVPDGATIVIGGLIDDQDTTSQAGIPGFSRLKHLGFLFRDRVSTVHKSELIVLLTPRILQRGGLPEPAPGVAPMGPMRIPNSGPMPGPAYVSALASAPGPRDPGDWGPEGTSDSEAVVSESSPPRDDQPSTAPQTPSPVPSDVTPAAAASSYHPGALTKAAFHRVGGDDARRDNPTTLPRTAGYKPGDLTRTLARRIRGERGGASAQPASSGPEGKDVEPSARAGAANALQDGRVQAAGFTERRPSLLSGGAPGSDSSSEVTGQGNGELHVVRSGEDFQSIAYDYYRSTALGEALWLANRQRVSAPSLLKPGVQIVIPRLSELQRITAQ
jgi:type II secretory pathway component GspD/PulD (secretin)